MVDRRGERRYFRRRDGRAEICKNPYQEQEQATTLHRKKQRMRKTFFVVAEGGAGEESVDVLGFAVLRHIR